MDAEERENLLAQAKELKAENDKLSALLQLPEVCSDPRLAAHYARRQRALSPVLAALDECERAGGEDALAVLRREMLLLSVTANEVTRACVGAGVCIRMRIYKDAPDASPLLSDLTSRLPGGLRFTLRESAAGFLRAECTGEGVLELLSALPENALGEGVRFAVYPILPRAEIRDEEIRTDVFLNGGKGGQNVNKVETAIRMTHLPTGVTVTCRDERSQLQNKKRAARLLRARVAEYYEAAQAALIERAKKKTL